MIAWVSKRAAPLAALAMGAALSGCGMNYNSWDEVEGVPLAELDMSGDAPDTIRLAGPDKVVITEGDTLTITLDGDEEAGAALRFDRDGSRLSIARDREIYDGRDDAIVRVTMPAPANLEIAGSGEIESDTLASTGELEIAGSGSISVANVDAESLEVDIAGSGDVTAAGTARKLEVDIAGSGDVDLRALTADEVKIGIAGSGNVQLSSNGTVDANIAGSGDINVTGSATCSVTTAGSGSLTCRNDATTAAATSEETEAEAEEGAAEE